MLICDDCEKAFHIYCLKPKLKKIPKGDWYCPVSFKITHHFPKFPLFSKNCLEMCARTERG